nr:M23 family metallopeptidase [Natronobacillus azotifigens]
MEQDQNIQQAQKVDLKEQIYLKEKITAQQTQLEKQLIDLERENVKLAKQIDEIEQVEKVLENELEANQITLDQLQAEQEKLEQEKIEEEEIAQFSQERTNYDGPEHGNASQRNATRPSNAPAQNRDSNFIWPTIGGVITSYQGPRWGSFHKGIDIARPDDYSILAADGGIVSFSGWINGYGNTIEIDHQNGYTTQYAHLESIHVTVGQQVNQGDIIGIMGTTGRSTGIHLDFEVYYRGELRDPMDVLP